MQNIAENVLLNVVIWFEVTTGFCLNKKSK